MQKYEYSGLEKTRVAQERSNKKDETERYNTKHEKGVDEKKKGLTHKNLMGFYQT